MYLGRNKLSVEETANRWVEVMNNRVTTLGGTNVTSTERANLGDGGILQKELNTAIAAVHRASFMSRSLQKRFCKDSVSKDDRSPVTIADFAVQAIVIDYLHKTFPADRFIAEEDSSVLKNDANVRGAVLEALCAAQGSAWTPQRLYDTVDLGGFSSTASRVWVLDPVDGTKGFMRGQHYCIALALLVDGKPRLSVMGCPNVNLDRVLQNTRVAEIAEPFNFDSSSSSTTAHPLGAGSIFYAVSGRGAWARSLAMPLGAGYEVSVSSVSDATSAALCESMEASHGDREVTEGVFKRLGLTRDYLRLDGQCKYCVVGSGAAEGNMRLPPMGYREKIWDHAPGVHFITEAGGTVTDLSGEELDFGQGRLLPECVNGILASNNLLHTQILEAVTHERELKKRNQQHPSRRIFLD